MISPLPSLYFEHNAGEVLTAPAGVLRTYRSFDDEAAAVRGPAAAQSNT
ncbi:hypothetical protein ACFP2F_01490 [Hymenobacter artigasi]|uniref:Uncharacterized protein n=1 Tax=Hymenobacter artigasi TaxID=2719616 RepID=A0ABX1HBV1_9BACT|nr:hypothetical protein [Hymenobacter artigasi]NKI87721.1 hypothetical protein [Hymenobacter artigasi]